MSTMHFEIVPKHRRMTREQYKVMRKMMRRIAYERSPGLFNSIQSALAGAMRTGTGFWRVSAPDA